MASFSKSSKIAFIGSGGVAGAFSIALSKNGYPIVAASSRTFASAEKLASRVKGCKAVKTLQEAADMADVVIITTFDGVIGDVADSIHWKPGQGAVHCSGVTKLDVFDNAVKQGAIVGSLHPLQAFASVEEAVEALPGSTFGIEAEGDMRKYLETMALDLGGHPIFLKAEDREIYHASVVTVGGLLMALIGIVADTWRDNFGVSRDDALRAVLPIIRGCADTLQANGIPGGIAGPYVRGDVGTVQKHLDAFKTRAPDGLQMYANIALAGLYLGREKGKADPKDMDAIEALLRKYIKDNPIS
ncbi:MAG: DUF2520 domain-containing protein [Chloroflexi bacterium]|nr:DUF2520 domain-containing protein [Chloroflexota bacterium]